MKKNLFFTPENSDVVFLLLFVFTLFQSLCGQTSTDYRGIFGSRYTDAVKYSTSQSWVTDSLRAYNINPCLAQSIVFPELIRYSALQDKMEIQSLLTLYVQYGEKYANFSVGRYQIKPTFTSQIEIILKNTSSFKDENLRTIDTTDTPAARLARVKRLDSPAWQLQYLIWFIKIMDKKFAYKNWKSETEKLRFYATAYNCGFNHTEQYIHQMSSRAFFHTALFKADVCYNYADISIDYWKICQEGDEGMKE